MTGQSLEITINLAFAIGKQRHHKYITVEHLLLALLDNQDALRALQLCQVDTTQLRSKLYDYIEKTTPHLPQNTIVDMQATLGFKDVLRRANVQAETLGYTTANGAIALTSILYEENSEAAHLLNEQGATLDNVTQLLNKRNVKQQRNINQAKGVSQMNTEDAILSSTQEQESEFFVNLNQRVKQGKIDALIGREDELMRIVQILSLRKKNNPVLIGEPGVGKTALVEGLAYAVENGTVPAFLRDATILSLDIAAMLAGTKYRGDFEKRFKQVLKTIETYPNAIIFIDEIHSILGAGSASGASLDTANLLKPLLTTGEMRVMGATTFKEHRNIFSKDAALARRFQEVVVKESSVEDTILILHGNRHKLEQHHGVIITEDAIEAATKMADRYIKGRFLPDKAIDVLDEACANVQINNKSKKKRLVSEEVVQHVISRISRIPCSQLTASDRDILVNLDKRLRKHIYGQEQAIDSLTQCIKLSRSGLRNEKKPIGCFLFAGPTGVGKTEVAIQLAEAMNVSFVRIDMSEYMEKHTASQLIGAPAGYVGHEQGGLLTEKVLKNPHCVLLLDEIEKAHPDIFNLLLQVMDHGTLTDNNGEEIDFRHTILIMTSNSGATVYERNSMGFAEQDLSTDTMMEIGSAFTPEFRNRLDAIVNFKPLDEDDIKRVVDKFMGQLKNQLNEKNVELVVKPSMKKWLAIHGYDRRMGARPIERLIEKEIKSTLADQLLFGKLRDGGKVVLSSRSDKVLIDID